MPKYAYLRVSTADQHLDRQYEAIKAYAKDTIPEENYIADKASGKDFDREEYQRLKSIIQPGDELVIKELDRLGRNKEAIKEELRWFADNHIVVRILDLPTSLMEIPKGQEWILDMVNNILVEVLAAMAQQERVKIRDRQAAGIAVAKSKGQYTLNHKGKPRKTVNASLFESLYQQRQQGKVTLTEAARALGVSLTVASKRMREREEVGEGYNPNETSVMVEQAGE